MNSTSQTADLIFFNGVIYTADDEEPIVEGIAVAGNLIIARGTTAEVIGLQKPGAELINLQGAFMMPAFIEGHGHFSRMGNALLNLDFLESRSWQSILDDVAEKVKTTPKGQWIFGGGWHQEKLSDLKEDLNNGFPNNAPLNAISPDHPVILEHASVHALMANQRAIELAGINEDTANPAGGEIQRNEAGELTGMFLETAMDLITDTREKEISTLSSEDQFDLWLNKIRAATEHCYENGVAAFHDMGAEFSELEYYKFCSQSTEAGIQLGIRLNASIWADYDEIEKNIVDYPYYDQRGFLQIRAIKKMMDGALGSRGAWLIEPYTDDADESGLQVHSVEEITNVAGLAAEKGMQLCVHAIGDKANQTVLDIMENATEGLEDHRWRIEHAQHLRTEDISRFANLGITASIQTVHCTSDCGFVPTRIGEQRAREGAYMWRALIDSGAKIANGTDVPVEALSPIENIYSAVSRVGESGEPFYPKQALTREEAIKSYTIYNARAAFLEDKMGSIEVGKLADFVLLSQNLLQIDKEAIPTTKVLMTVVDGEIKYRKGF